MLLPFRKFFWHPFPIGLEGSLSFVVPIHILPIAFYYYVYVLIFSLNINGWEMPLSLGFFATIRYYGFFYSYIIVGISNRLLSKGYYGCFG